MTDQPMPGVRADIWLWAARFFKTRSLAKQAIESSRLAVDGATATKPAKAIHIGNLLQIQRGEERYVIEVLALSEQRGSAVVAQALYRETAESRVEREAAREQKRIESQSYHAPQGKPDKRARRLIRALGDLDAL